MRAPVESVVPAVWGDLARPGGLVSELAVQEDREMVVRVETVAQAVEAQEEEADGRAPFSRLLQLLQPGQTRSLVQESPEPVVPVELELPGHQVVRVAWLDFKETWLLQATAFQLYALECHRDIWRHILLPKS